MSTARLWRDQGKREEARELLAPVNGWFTEGFDTRDLKEPGRCLTNLGRTKKLVAEIAFTAPAPRPYAYPHKYARVESEKSDCHFRPQHESG
jgi:hypothetical protein